MLIIIWSIDVKGFHLKVTISDANSKLQVPLSSVDALRHIRRSSTLNVIASDSFVSSWNTTPSLETSSLSSTDSRVVLPARLPSSLLSQLFTEYDESGKTCSSCLVLTAAAGGGTIFLKIYNSHHVASFETKS